MGYWQNNDADYWRREHDEKERQLSRIQQEHQEERQRRQQEILNLYQESLSTANDWNDAIDKAIYRFGYEIRMNGDDAEIDNLFQLELKHVEAAKTMIAEYEESVQAEIAGILHRRNQAVLKRLQEMFPDEGSSTLNALEEDDFSILVNW